MTLQDLCILLFCWHTGHITVIHMNEMCGQSHHYVRKAHPLYARENADISRFCWVSSHPIPPVSSTDAHHNPIENQTGQAPFWKNWCAKSVSGVGLCEASALRPEQIGKLWLLGNSWSLCLATIGHQLQRRFLTKNSPMYQKYPKISRNVSVLPGVTRQMWM